MRSISYRAPAKIILSGEHSVVYGKPALVSGFNLHCTITLHAGKGKKKLDVHMQKIYDIVFAHLKKQTPKLEMKDFRLQISNEIPVGRGMGSSAALSVAFVAAILHFYTGKVPEKEVVNSLAYQAEKHFHGNPSGADNTACCYGGLIFYRKEFEFLKTISALNSKLPQNIERHLFLIDTGKAAESTAEMVRNVQKVYNTHPKETDQTLYALEKTTKRLVVSVIKEDPGMFRESIKENGKLLQKLKIISPRAEEALNRLRSFGVGKITGAGGLKNASGFILFYADNPEQLVHYMIKNSMNYYPFVQDYKGVYKA
jgi:mevalonate kinase